VLNGGQVLVLLLFDLYMSSEGRHFETCTYRIMGESAVFLCSISDLHTDKNLCRYIYGTKEQFEIDFHKIASSKGKT